MSQRVCTLFETEVFADGYADGWRDLCYHFDVVIFQCIPYRIYVTFDDDSARRTYHAALSTADTLCFRKVFLKRRRDHHLGASLCKAQNAYALNLGTHSHTVAAKYAFCLLYTSRCV